MKEAERRMQLAESAFKRASDSVPSGNKHLKSYFRSLGSVN